MKKTYFFTALAAAALMTACSTDNDFTSQSTTNTGAKATFFVDNGPVTRTAVNTEDASTKFVAGDEIGITATGGAVATNFGYKVEDVATGALSPLDNPVEWTTEAAGTFYAYYPYGNGTATADKATFTVKDQTTEDDFNKNDFLVSTATDIAYTSPVNFKFVHGLTLIQVSLVGDKSENATEVTLKAKPTVEWTYDSNEFAPAGTETDIKMWKISGTEQTYWAMIPAQTIANGTVFATIVANGNKFTYTTTADVELNTAKIKKFILKLGKTGVATDITTDIDINGWGEDDGEIEGETTEEDVPAVELISAAEITAETPFASQQGKQNCVEGWNYIMPETNGSAVIDADESAFAITKTAGSWFNGTIYYCTAEGKATKAVYELKFKMKSTEGNDIQIAVMPCLNENYYFQRVRMNNSYVYQTATDAYVEYTFKFDLSKLQTTANSADTVTPTAEQINKILVYFTPKEKSDTNTFYIKDVTFIEVKE